MAEGAPTGRKAKAQEHTPPAEETKPVAAETAPDATAPAAPETLKVTIVNVDDLAEEAARDHAERTLTASKESLRGFGGFFKKMWQHGIAREYYRQKQLARSRELIREKEDLYAAEQNPEIERTAHQQAMHVLVDRFASEYEETLHAGEERRTLDVKASESDRSLKEGINTLLRDYASGKLDDTAFAEERTRLLQEVPGTKEEVAKKSMYADNLLEVARQLKMSVAHGKSIDDLDIELDVKIGRAKDSIRTKANYNAVDKIIEKIKSTKLGVLVNEATLATAVSIAYSVGVGFSRRVASSRVASALTFGGSALVAGVFTGYAENKRLKEDRRQHAREMAQGRTYEHGKSPRREEMDKYIHEMQDAGSLATSLRARMYDDLPDGRQVTKELSEAERNDAIAHLADIEARIALSEAHSIDLVAYSNPTAVERERFDLDMARAHAKADLLKMEAKRDGEKADINELLKVAIAARTNELVKGDEGIEKRNALFNADKRKKVAVAAVKGAALGLVIGGVAQEVTAFADNHQVGFFERLVRGNHMTHAETARATPTEWLHRYMQGTLPPAEQAMHTVSVPGNGHLTLPESMRLVQDDSGLTLVEGDRVIAHGLTFTADGAPTPDTLQALQQEGLISSTTINQITHTATTSTGPAEYVARHPEEFGRVHRTLWFDNDTPKPVFDRNELRLWWGGQNNVGVDAEGRYTFTMDHMMRDGSFHHGLNVDARHLAAEGKLRMLFTISQDTQATPIEVPIDAEGNVHIDPNSETGRLLFRTGPDGHAQFLGRFAEVAEVTGTENGTDSVRVLATYVGEGLPSATDTIQTTVPEATTIIEPPQDYHIDPPPIIPIFGRRPLEPVNGTRPPFPTIGMAGYYYGGGHRMSPADRIKYRERLSATLRNKPNAKLDSRKEAGLYLGKQEEKHMERVREMVAQTEPMSPEVRVSVCIPVAGHQEAENIEKTLSLYLHQTADPASFELVLFVNQPEVNKDGTPVHSDGTLKKAEDFKKNHPDINVRIMHGVLSLEDANIGNIRKLLNDANLLRSYERGGKDDVLFVSTDADSKGVAPEYIANFEKRFNEQPETDAMMGQLDWDPESYIRNPLVHVGTRLMQYFSEQMRFKKLAIASSGANFAFRSSIYAAVGGYTNAPGFAEDVELGRRIMASRSGTRREPIKFAGARVSRLYTSSRRAEKAIADGLSPSEQWEKGFGVFDDDVRKTKWEDTGGAPDYDDPVVVKKLVGELETVVNRTLAATKGWYGHGPYEDMRRRALGWLGVKYRLIGKNRIEITDATELIEGLKQYSKDGMDIMARKTGKEVSKKKGVKTTGETVPERPRVRVKAGSRPSPAKETIPAAPERVTKAAQEVVQTQAQRPEKRVQL